ncbi:MAG TPA: hypothetical protein PLI59_05595, partial [Candidatus Obscuribacter sp.]|nr:hypothetical protein [Candidatus Obscuribacter sp.]
PPPPSVPPPRPRHYATAETMNIFDSADFPLPVANALHSLVESHLLILRTILKTALAVKKPVRYVLDADHRFEPVARALAERLRQDGHQARGFYSALPDQTYYAVDIVG